MTPIEAAGGYSYTFFRGNRLIVLIVFWVEPGQPSRYEST